MQQETDKNKKIEQSATSIAGVGDSPCEDFVSAGTRFHNELTYRGVDWLLNSAVGVGFTYATSRTELGKALFTNPVKNFYKAIVGQFVKHPETLEKSSRMFTMFASIMAGGFAIVPVMSFLEKHKNKKAIIRAVDNMCYGKEAVENDPRFAECYKAIDEEPAKDISTGMWARWAAILPLITAVSIPGVDKHLESWIYQPIASLSKGAAKVVGIKPGKMAVEGAMELNKHTNAREFVNNWDFLHTTIGFDFGLTVFYSMLHEMAYKTFAKWKGAKEDDDAPAPATSAPAASAPATPSSTAPSTPIYVPEEPTRPEPFVQRAAEAEQFITAHAQPGLGAGAAPAAG